MFIKSKKAHSFLDKFHTSRFGVIVNQTRKLLSNSLVRSYTVKQSAINIHVYLIIGGKNTFGSVDANIKLFNSLLNVSHMDKMRHMQILFNEIELKWLTLRGIMIFVGAIFR